MAKDTTQILQLIDEAYAIRVSDLKRSITLCEEALQLSKEVSHRPLMAQSYSRLSLFYMIRGDYDISMKMSEDAIALYTELDDEKGVADAKYSIAGIYYKTDNYHLGLMYLIDCLEIYKKYNDHHNISRTSKTLGTIYEYFGDDKNAVVSYQNAIESARLAGDTNLESNAYNNLSGLYLKQGRMKEAEEMIEKSILMKSKTGDTRGLAFSIYGRGKVNYKYNRFNKAEEDYLNALEIHHKMGERLGAGMAYAKLGSLYLHWNKLPEAKEILFKGLDFAEEFNITIIKFKCDYLLYHVFKKENNAEKSLEYLEKYLSQKETVINTQTLKVIENYDLINKMEGLKRDAEMQKERAEIIEKKNRAEHAAKVKEDFLSVMSHEIRTPLNAVITIASLLGNNPREEDAALVDSLRFSANNLLHLVNDILDFTKLDTGNVKLDFRQTDIRKLFENIQGTYQNIAREKGLEILLKVNDNLASAYELDETKLSQVIGNLVSNSIKYTERGTIIIELEKTGARSEYDNILFKVTDTGIGIDSIYHKDIFESFYQPASITTKKQGGSGLGLAIVKRLVELHGSEVYINSQKNNGATFFFTLKLKPSQVSSSKSIINTSELSGKIILLAEDNPVNAMVNTRLLRNWGIQSDLAVNGLEAVTKASQKEYDYILMDIHMPEMDGFEATKIIRTTSNFNTDKPIFALTADVTAEHREGYTDYFNAFLHKPIHHEKLFEALMNAAAKPTVMRQQSTRP